MSVKHAPHVWVRAADSPNAPSARFGAGAVHFGTKLLLIGGRGASDGADCYEYNLGTFFFYQLFFAQHAHARTHARTHAPTPTNQPSHVLNQTETGVWNAIATSGERPAPRTGHSTVFFENSGEIVPSFCVAGGAQQAVWSAHDFRCLDATHTYTHTTYPYTHIHS